MAETTASYTNQPKKSKSKLMMFIVLILIIAAIVGGFFLFKKNGQSSKEESNTSVSEMPSPSPTPKIDKSKVKIQVQNGTGTPGQAGTAVDAIKKAGYNADNIKTDNAADYNHKTTTISAKEGFESVAKDISNALEGTFTDIKVDSTPLDSGSEFDVVVITGGKIFETTAPTSAATPTGTSTSPTTAPTDTPTPTPTPTP